MKTLLLNNDYRPLKVISWERAVSLFYLDKVEIVKEHPTREIRSASIAFKFPTVVRLKSMVRHLFNRNIRLNRHNVYLRDKGICQYCGRFVPKNKATLDHVIPKSRGGSSGWSNLVLCCTPCNRYKDNLLLSEAGMSLLKLPTRPNFLPVDLTETEMQSQWKDWLNEENL